MAAPTPTTEPQRIVAGDSLHWSISLADYPASDGWVLKYRAVNLTANFSITATADGDAHDVAVAAAVSAAWTAGDYTLTAYVEGPAAERITLYSKPVTVLPDLASATALDARSGARQILAALRALYEQHITSGRALTESYTIAGRSFKFISAADLLAQIAYWEREANREDIAAGTLKRRRSFVRFIG